MSWKVEVERVSNGFIVRNLTEDDENVIVFSDDRETPVEAAQSMLYELVEIFGVNPSRYAAQRINIRIEPGDKYTQQEN